jgi:hypothetical protein
MPPWWPDRQLCSADDKIRRKRSEGKERIGGEKKKGGRRKRQR